MKSIGSANRIDSAVGLPKALVDKLKLISVHQRVRIGRYLVRIIEKQVDKDYRAAQVAISKQAGMEG